MSKKSKEARKKERKKKTAHMWYISYCMTDWAGTWSTRSESELYDLSQPMAVNIRIKEDRYIPDVWGQMLQV